MKMTNKNLCEIAIIMDRSGSMASIQKDMEGGLKNFIQEQQKFPGECLISLYKFDDQYEVAFEEKRIFDVVDVSLIPRGTTALYDAVGKTVTAIGERLAKKPEEKRPGSVIVMIVTDGFENASKEYKREKIKEMVLHQKNTYNWQFVFLGTNPDTFDRQGQELGIYSNSTYTPSAAGARNMYRGMGQAIGGYRSSVAINDSNPTLNVPKDLTEK